MRRSWAFSLAAALLATASASAQERDAGARRAHGGSRPAEARGTQPTSGPAGGAVHGEPAGWLWGPRLAQQLLRPSPEDQGPLRPGEEDELLAFAREHMPRFYQLLETVRQRSPERFRERLAEHAPRLRHMKRVFEYSPRVGGIIRTHAENLLKIHREARSMRAAAAGSAERERALQTIRALLAENVGLEADALDALAEGLAAQRDARIDKRLTYLTGEGVDLSGETEELRALVAAYQSTAAGPERDALREKIRAEVGAQLDKEAAGLRQRATDVRSQAEQEVQERVQRLTSPPTSRGAEHRDEKR